MVYLITQLWTDIRHMYMYVYNIKQAMQYYKTNASNSHNNKKMYVSIFMFQSWFKKSKRTFWKW